MSDKADFHAKIAVLATCVLGAVVTAATARAEAPTHWAQRGAAVHSLTLPTASHVAGASDDGRAAVDL